jgi:hypothetical protein
LRQLSRATLAGNTASASLQALGFDGLCALCRQSAQRHAPEPFGSLDPRLALPVAYSEARAHRLAEDYGSCAVCENRTCPAADVTALPGDDVAWLTPNLYPILLPRARGAPPPHDGAQALPLHGVHLVHWSSLRHDGGLVGANGAVAAALLSQLACAEGFLLHEAGPEYPESGAGPDGLPHRGHAGFIKNRGRRVGGSVEHDHQQLLLSSQAFAEPPLSRGLRARLLADGREALRVDDVGGLARTLVPPFMRRPLHAFVVPVAPDAGWLHHMLPDVRDACALAIARLAHAVDGAMATGGQEPAWNLTCLSGPGCGPVFELRAYTQPLGGYEHLGLYLCEERPETSAARLREARPR